VSSRSHRSTRTPLTPPSKLKIAAVEIVIIEDRCKGCGFCIEFCPRKVLERSDKLNIRGVHPPYVKNPDACVGCRLCEDICPDLAIFVKCLEENNREEA